jgi:Fasciclin domain
MTANCVAVLFLAATALAGHSNIHSPPPARSAGGQTIADIAVGNPDFSTLVAALKAAGLVETLQGAGPFTVFAPNNAAFAKIPAATLNGLLADVPALKAVLLRHVVPANIPVSVFLVLFVLQRGEAAVIHFEMVVNRSEFGFQNRWEKIRLWYLVCRFLIRGRH